MIQNKLEFILNYFQANKHGAPGSPTVSSRDYKTTRDFRTLREWPRGGVSDMRRHSHVFLAGAQDGRWRTVNVRGIFKTLFYGVTTVLSPF